MPEPEVWLCPNCGSDDLASWTRQTQHGDADGMWCRTCELFMGDGQDIDGPILADTEER